MPPIPQPARREPRSLPVRRAALPLAGPPEIAGGVAKWEGVRVEGTPPEVVATGSAAFFDCDLDGLSLAGERIELRLVDCTATALDLANAELPGLELTCTVLRDSRLVGAALGGALRDVVISDCVLDLASLRMCTLSRCELRGCSLVEAGLYAADLESVLFDGCDLTAADVSGATFDRCELERCTLQDLRGIDALRGARIPLADLLPITPLLASALGIVVTE
ncbi:MAG TPA: pentapeptide repeat-containing protein [Gaiellales bacterium]